MKYRNVVIILLALAVVVVVVAIWPATQTGSGPTSTPAVSATDPSAGIKQPNTPDTTQGPVKSTPEKKPRLNYRSADVASVPEADLIDLIRDPSYSPTTRNDAANRLLNDRDPRLAQALIQMLCNEKEDVTWRNYCIQFLRGCYEQQPANTASVPPGVDKTAQRQAGHTEILAALFQASEYSEPELSSCAIWSLAQLAAPKPWADTMPGVSKLNVSLLPGDANARTKELALKVLRDEKAHLLVRTGGVQSCARMGLTEAAPDLRKIAADPKADLSIRTVAIAGLGQLKDESSRELLTQLANDSSPRLNQAAQLALKSLGACAHSPVAPAP